jgi:hypothetical protein
MTPQPQHIGTVDWPEEWMTADVQFAAVLSTAALPDGNAVLMIGMLQDGTNLLGLSYPGGQRLLRSCEANGWALEERFAGRPRTDRPIKRMWKVAVESIVQALAEARADGPEL